MAAIFDSYFIQLQEIVQQQDVDSEIQQKMLDEERKRFLHSFFFSYFFYRFAQCQQQLFGSENASSNLLWREIKVRNDVLKMEKRVLMVQAKWRGIKARKTWGKLVRNTITRSRIAR